MNEKWISKNISNVRKKQRKDLGQLGVIKDQNSNILYREEDIKKGWMEYFARQLDTENEMRY